MFPFLLNICAQIVGKVVQFQNDPSSLLVRKKLHKNDNYALTKTNRFNWPHNLWCCYYFFIQFPVRKKNQQKFRVTLILIQFARFINILSIVVVVVISSSFAACIWNSIECYWNSCLHGNTVLANASKSFWFQKYTQQKNTNLSTIQKS